MSVLIEHAMLCEWLRSAEGLFLAIDAGGNIETASVVVFPYTVKTSRDPGKTRSDNQSNASSFYWTEQEILSQDE